MADSRNSKPVLIVEDHPLVADATALLLARIDPGLDVTIRHCAASALATFKNSPGWFRIFLDLDVPGATGLSLARQFVQLGMADSLAIITAHNKPMWQDEAHSLGILAYIVKACPVHEFTEALARVIGGRRTYSGAASVAVPAAPLTRRQQDMLNLLCRGYSSKDIASQLRISQGTVDNHISGVLRALQVSNRTHAVARAIELGYN